MNISLKNKIIVITGAAGFLGQNFTKKIIESGGVPILIDNNKSNLIKFANNIQNEYNFKPKFYCIDITKEKKIKETSIKIIKIYKKIDALINNAANNPAMKGNNLKSRLEKYDLNTWNEDIAVSLTGSFLCSKYFGNLINKNKSGGVIINISSDLGLIAPNQDLYKNKNQISSVKPVSYSVTKHGIIGLTRYLSTYWPTKVRSNAICPAGIYNNHDNNFVNRISTLIPMKRMANVDEVSNLLIYLLSSSSTYINGAIIPIDGGRTAW